MYKRSFLTASVALIISACGGGPAPDIEVPVPIKPRNDVLYGYFASLYEQVAEVKDHTNLHWEAQFDGPVKAVQNIRDAATFTVLDIGYQLFVKDSGGKMLVATDAEQKVRSFLQYLKSQGVLHYVKVLYPLDEPNLNLRNPSDIYQAVETTHKVAKEFPELKGYKLGVIYWDEAAYTGIELFDWVGFDNYDAKSSILEYPNGRYFKMRSQLRTDQRTILVPGGSFDQDPEPFVNFAMTHLEVVAVIPFAWLDVDNEKEKIKGIRSRVVKDKYIEAGRRLTGKFETTVGE